MYQRITSLNPAVKLVSLLLKLWARTFTVLSLPVLFVIFWTRTIPSTMAIFRCVEDVADDNTGSLSTSYSLATGVLEKPEWTFNILLRCSQAWSAPIETNGISLLVTDVASFKFSPCC